MGDGANALEYGDARYKWNGTQRHVEDEREGVDATGEQFPDQIETSEREARHGHIDEVDREHHPLVRL